MNRTFLPEEFFPIPDGTLVCPVLNPWDAMTTDLPPGFLRDVSLAVGRIEPGVTSQIHALPLVQQVICLIDGTLTVRMKDVESPSPYSRLLSAPESRERGGCGVVVQPGTFFQLLGSEQEAHVLYISSPEYLFLIEKEEVVYEDTVLLGRDWEALAAQDWRPSELRDLEELRWRREHARQRSIELAFLAQAS